MELNAEQIKKALECCSGTEDDRFDVNCNECPFEIGINECRSLDSLAFSLIKELTEEVADWKAIAEQYQKQFEEAKADTVREMQERLIAEFRKDDRMNYYIRMTIDQIAKEMLEEK